MVVALCEGAGTRDDGGDGRTGDAVGGAGHTSQVRAGSQ